MTLLKVENLTKSYEVDSKPLEVLKGINLKVNAGQFIAIMGASGSGKSTFLNILSSIDIQTDGVIEIDGQYTITEKTGKKERIHLRRHVTSLVFQSFNLIDQLTALENVMLPVTISGKSFEEAKDSATKALKRLGLAHRLNHLPEDMSGGEKQRVAIGRALVMGPKLILADEPTGNLDSKTGLDMISIFKELKRDGISTLLVTHDANLAKQADKIFILKKGLLKEESA